MIGRTVAHYEIIEKLGSGGMGDVYRARDTKLNREVAIKVLPEEFSRDESRRKRFAREAQAVAALKHPNIVTIYSVEEIDDINFITMEFIEGGTLAKRIPKVGVSLDQFFDYAIPLADALSSAHDQGITHRDLKPANVMFDRDGRLKVLDFGLAKLLDRSAETEGAATVVESGDTGIGQVMGTAAYMSPEQAEGKPIDHRSDIFSLGIMLFEMATGDRPFKGDTQISTISAILKDRPPHISEIKSELPRHVGRIVNHCLEKNADKRYQSAKDVRNELEGLRKEVDSGELSGSMYSGAVAARPQRAMKWKPLAIGAGVVAVAIIGLFALRGRDDGAPAVTSLVPPPKPAATTPATLDNKKMAVVLPFENLGPAEDAYFAAGMTEEISSRLSAVSGIGVISSTSANQYDRAGKTMKEIGKDLGVDYVLEGSVRWAKGGDGVGRMRITPKLIRVSDDSQMWAQTYDRDTKDIFEVQTDIATQVVAQLGVTLQGGEQQRLAEAPTQNMEAYNYYMKAKNYVDASGDFYKHDQAVVGFYEKAVELDPGFIHAWADLSMHHSTVYFGPLDKTDDRLSRARRALKQAEALAPDHYKTHLARGSYYYYGFGNYEQALDEYLIATRLMPSDAIARSAVGYIYRRQGKWADCIENLSEAARLNPQESSVFNGLASTYRAMREFELAMPNYERVMELDPHHYEAMMMFSNAYSAWRGDTASARKVLEKYAAPTAMHAFAWSQLYVNAGEYDKARARVDDIEMGGIGTVFKLGLYGILDYFQKGPAGATESLTAANQALEEVLGHAPDNTVLRAFLSNILAMQGRDEEAVREAKLCIEQDAKDLFEGPNHVENLAGVYALIGRDEEAIDILEQLLKQVYEGSITPYRLLQERSWDNLRDNPRFQALLPRNI